MKHNIGTKIKAIKQIKSKWVCTIYARIEAWTAGGIKSPDVLQMLVQFCGICELILAQWM